LNYARSDFDRRHSFQGNAVYDFAFGKVVALPAMFILRSSASSADGL